MYHNALRSSLQPSVQSLLAALISTQNVENTIRTTESKLVYIKKRKYLIVEIPSTIPRKEILSIAHFQLLRKQENKGKFD